MDKILDTYTSPRPNQGERKTSERPIKVNETESITKRSSSNKSPGPNSFTTDEKIEY